MLIAQLLAAGLLAVLALAHSYLGEVGVLRPLFEGEWAIEAPRWAAERILRFAWHLTSLAWVGLAAVVLDVNYFVAVAAVCLVSAAIIFVSLRGHLAWPLFLISGLAALYADNLVPTLAMQVFGFVTAAVLAAAAILHLYWVAGGSWLLDQASPPARTAPEEGEEPFRPGRLLTAAVALMLFAFAGLVALAALDVGPVLLRWLTWIGVAVLAVRAVGDGRIAGFTKTQRGSTFADADDRIFTPLVVGLGIGAVAALLVGV